MVSPQLNSRLGFINPGLIVWFIGAKQVGHPKPWGKIDASGRMGSNFSVLAKIENMFSVPSGND